MSRRRSKRATAPVPAVDEVPILAANRVALTPWLAVVEPRTSVDPELWCPGPCNRKARRSLKENPAASVSGNTLAGQPHWCPDCHHHLARALRSVDDCLVDLATRTDGRLAPPEASDREEKRGKPSTFGSPSPAWDLANETENWLHSWVISLADHRDDRDDQLMPRDLAGIVTPTASRSLAYLTRHLPELLASPDAPTFGRQLLTQSERLIKACGLDDPVHVLKGEPCPSCDRKALIRHDGASKVICRHCKASWDEARFEHLALTLTETA